MMFALYRYIIITTTLRANMAGEAGIVLEASVCVCICVSRCRTKTEKKQLIINWCNLLATNMCYAEPLE